MKIQDTDSHALSWSNHPTLLARSMLLSHNKKGKKGNSIHVCIPAFSSIPPHDCLAQANTLTKK
jgi:hypothetical protein